MTQSMKRIHKVTIKHIPDMDYRGEDAVGTFDNEAKSEYAIELESPCYGYHYEGYKFYNAPVENYLGLDPTEIRKYVQQDYERMKQYQLGEFDYLGIRADAEIHIPSGSDSRGGTCYTIQHITSGAVWGIESDAGDYLKEMADEQLHELRDQLHAIGFSNRAITAAFRNVERDGN